MRVLAESFVAGPLWIYLGHDEQNVDIRDHFIFSMDFGLELGCGGLLYSNLGVVLRRFLMVLSLSLLGAVITIPKTALS